MALFIELILLKSTGKTGVGAYKPSVGKMHEKDEERAEEIFSKLDTGCKFLNLMSCSSNIGSDNLSVFMNSPDILSCSLHSLFTSRGLLRLAAGKLFSRFSFCNGASIMDLRVNSL